ncbi:hypothetical protein RB195_013358 [Necator americanus]|uniref:Uncharacterized protein n=1 Tax=Necator americanus TaxID=51031 RepID=A0ABR1DVJ6_NECAM
MKGFDFKQPIYRAFTDGDDLTVTAKASCNGRHILRNVCAPPNPTPPRLRFAENPLGFAGGGDATVDAAIEGEADQEGRAPVNAAWTKWKMATGVLCDKKVHVRLKLKIHKTFSRPDKWKDEGGATGMVWLRLAAREKFCCQNRSEARCYTRDATLIPWLDRAKQDMIDARLCTAEALDRSKWKTRSRKADPTTTRDKV